MKAEVVWVKTDTEGDEKSIFKLVWPKYKGRNFTPKSVCSSRCI